MRKVSGSAPSPQSLNEPKSLYHGPSSASGSVRFQSSSLARSAALIARSSGPDQVTADASLVVLDFLLRHAAIAPGAPEYCALDALRLNRA